MQAGAHEKDIGSFLCYGKDSIQEQCSGCDNQNWGHNSNQLNFMLHFALSPQDK